MSSSPGEGRWEEAVRSATLRIRTGWVMMVLWLALGAYGWIRDLQLPLLVSGAGVLITGWGIVKNFRRRSLLHLQRSRDRKRRRHAAPPPDRGAGSIR